ncbi:16S rRNA (uracil(1498)-N(3))-methyltransferase [Aquibacillus kalidii]|uniref:16S rRNA (uracil(1498)-N(3))-methyltransferase n=1 Tax=Aquibacillus kalidii TaxID=2762597 RepID=UPI001646D70D|nr:16S rRNA (uracil(1498)-N(3))-methyltransferase [Aquibacillus kalidii]
MQRYFVATTDWISPDKARITGDDVHHISRVMRMTEGDQVICVNSGGQAATCEITHIDSDEVKVSVLEWKQEEVELPVEVTIAQGLPKGDKLELILQKGTELGARKFIPYQASRSIVKWDQKKATKKLDRYHKIIKEASEQAHRSVIPSVETVVSFQNLIEKSKSYDVKLMAYEEEARSDQPNKLSQVFNTLERDQTIFTCIGPEGGFTPEEVEALKVAGFVSVRLGPRILRTETAAMYFLSSLSYHFEELGC